MAVALGDSRLARRQRLPRRDIASPRIRHIIRRNRDVFMRPYAVDRHVSVAHDATVRIRPAAESIAAVHVAEAVFCLNHRAARIRRVNCIGSVSTIFVRISRRRHARRDIARPLIFDLIERRADHGNREFRCDVSVIGQACGFVRRYQTARIRIFERDAVRNGGRIFTLAQLARVPVQNVALDAAAGNVADIRTHRIDNRALDGVNDLRSDRGQERGKRRAARRGEIAVADTAHEGVVNFKADAVELGDFLCVRSRGAGRRFGRSVHGAAVTLIW